MLSKTKLLTIVPAAIVCFVGLGLPRARAAQFTLTFDTDLAGNPLDALALDTHQPGERTDISDIWSPIGIDLRVEGSSKPLGLFNSNCDVNETFFGVKCTGGDPDLATGPEFGTDPRGNLLIIEENPGNGAPDDDRRGGTIVFDFNEEIIISAILQEIVFVDDAKGSIDVLFTDGSNQRKRFAATEENQLLLFSGFEQKSLDSLSINFNGSGGIDALIFSEFNPVPGSEVAAVPEGEMTFGVLAFTGLVAFLKWQRPKASRVLPCGEE